MNARKTAIDELNRIASRGETTMRLDAWAKATPGAEALVAEWRAICAASGKDEAVSLLHIEEGPVFIVACENGLHRSTESHLYALAELVAAHRE